jgi:hypothetical protein
LERFDTRWKREICFRDEQVKKVKEIIFKKSRELKMGFI